MSLAKEILQKYKQEILYDGDQEYSETAIISAMEEYLIEMSKPNLTGLISDGYTFICPIHGLHPNCSCENDQVKVYSEQYLETYSLSNR